MGPQRMLNRRSLLGCGESGSLGPATFGYPPYAGRWLGCPAMVASDCGLYSLMANMQLLVVRGLVLVLV